MRSRMTYEERNETVTTAQVAGRYGFKPAFVEHVLNENHAKAIRDCRKALPIHLSHRNDLGPQGPLARSISRSLIGQIRLLTAEAV